MLRRERLCEAARERRPVLGLARCARLQHPRADEEVNHLVLPRHRGERQWLFTVHRTLANRRTVLHEPSDHREMATVSRRVQRCRALAVGRAHVGAVAQRFVKRDRIVLMRGVAQPLVRRRRDGEQLELKVERGVRRDAARHTLCAVTQRGGNGHARALAHAHHAQREIPSRNDQAAAGAHEERLAVGVRVEWRAVLD